MKKNIWLLLAATLSLNVAAFANGNDDGEEGTDTPVAAENQAGDGGDNESSSDSQD